MFQKDIKKRLAFAHKQKRLLPEDFWTSSISFYLDGTSFAHKSNPCDQAKCQRSMVWQKRCVKVLVLIAPLTDLSIYGKIYLRTFDKRKLVASTAAVQGGAVSQCFLRPFQYSEGHFEKVFACLKLTNKHTFQ